MFEKGKIFIEHSKVYVKGRCIIEYEQPYECSVGWSEREREIDKNANPLISTITFVY